VPVDPVAASGALDVLNRGVHGLGTGVGDPGFDEGLDLVPPVGWSFDRDDDAYVAVALGGMSWSATASSRPGRARLVPAVEAH
jgi:hypothetical protein